MSNLQFDTGDISSVDLETQSANEGQSAYNSSSAEQAKQGFTNQANVTVTEFENRLANLPDSMKASINDNIVSYWRHSADRFDRNGQAGLNLSEFTSFQDNALSRLDSVLEDYLPSEEEQAEAQEAERSLEEAEANLESSAGSIERLDVDSLDLDSMFSPEALSDPENLANAIATYQGVNSEIGIEVNNVQTRVGQFTEAFQEVQESRQTFLGAARQMYHGVGNVFRRRENRNGEDHEVDRLRLRTIARLRDVQALVTDKQNTYIQYGENMNNASSNLLANTEEQYQAAVAEMGLEGEQLTHLTEEQQQQLQERLEQRNALVEQKENLIHTNEALTLRIERVEANENQVEEDQSLINEGKIEIDNAVTTLQEVLSQEGLPEDRRVELQASLDELLTQQSQVNDTSTRLEGASQNLDSQETDLSEESTQTTMDIQQLTEYRGNLDVSISSLETSITSLDLQLAEHGEISAIRVGQLEQQLNDLRGFDATVGDTVLDANLQTAQAVSGIQGQIDYLESVHVTQGVGHDFWDATVGGMGTLVRGIGNGFETSASWLREQGILGEGLAFPLSLVGGLFEGVGLMAEDFDQVFTEAGWNGIRAIVGRDPETGEWSFATAGRTVGVILESFVGGEYYGEEDRNIGRGFGVGIANIASLFIGVGEVKAGSEVALATFRAAEGSRALAMARAMGRGTSYMARGVVDDIARVSVETLRGIGRIPGGIRNLPGRLVTEEAQLARRLGVVTEDIARFTDEVATAERALGEALGEVPAGGFLEMSLDDFVRAMEDTNIPGGQQNALTRQFRGLSSGTRRIAVAEARQAGLQASLEFAAELSIHPNAVRFYRTLGRTSSMTATSFLRTAREFGTSLSGGARTAWNATVRRWESVLGGSSEAWTTFKEGLGNLRETAGEMRRGFSSQAAMDDALRSVEHADDLGLADDLIREAGVTSEALSSSASVLEDISVSSRELIDLGSELSSTRQAARTMSQDLQTQAGLVSDAAIRRMSRSDFIERVESLSNHEELVTKFDELANLERRVGEIRNQIREANQAGRRVQFRFDTVEEARIHLPEVGAYDFYSNDGWHLQKSTSGTVRDIPPGSSRNFGIPDDVPAYTEQSIAAEALENQVEAAGVASADNIGATAPLDNTFRQAADEIAARETVDWLGEMFADDIARDNPVASLETNKAGIAEIRRRQQAGARRNPLAGVSDAEIDRVVEGLGPENPFAGVSETELNNYVSSADNIGPTTPVIDNPFRQAADEIAARETADWLGEMFADEIARDNPGHTPFAQTLREMSEQEARSDLSRAISEAAQNNPGLLSQLAHSEARVISNHIIQPIVRRLQLPQDFDTMAVAEQLAREFEPLHLADLPEAAATEPITYIDSQLNARDIATVYDEGSSLVDLPTDVEAQIADYTHPNSNIAHSAGTPVRVDSGGGRVLARETQGSSVGGFSNGTEDLTLTGNSRIFQLRANSNEQFPRIRYYEVADTSGASQGYIAGTFLKAA